MIDVFCGQLLALEGNRALECPRNGQAMDTGRVGDWEEKLTIFRKVFPWIQTEILKRAGLPVDTVLGSEGKHEDNLAFNKAHDKYKLGSRSENAEVIAIHERQSREWQELTGLPPLDATEAWRAAAVAAGATTSEFDAHDLCWTAERITAWVLGKLAVVKVGSVAAVAPPSGKLNEVEDAIVTPTEESAAATPSRDEVLKQLTPARRKAYFGFVLAEQQTEAPLQDRAAYDLLAKVDFSKDDDQLEKLADYELPTFATWGRQLRVARKALGEQKNTPRRGRDVGKSVITEDQIDRLP